MPANLNIPDQLAAMLERAEPPKCTCGAPLMMFSPDDDICGACGAKYPARISGLYDKEKARLARALLRVWPTLTAEQQAEVREELSK